MLVERKPVPRQEKPFAGQAHGIDGLDDVDNVQFSTPTLRKVTLHKQSGIVSICYFAPQCGEWTTVGTDGFAFDALMLTRGSNRHFIGDLDGEAFTIEPHGCFRISCIPAGVVGQVRFFTEANISSLLLFPPGRLANMMPQGTGAMLKPIAFSEDERLTETFDLIEREILCSVGGHPGHIETLTRTLAGYLASFGSQDVAERDHRLTISPHRLNRVLDFIDANLAHAIGLAEMASVAGLSPFHFARVFKHATGKSPYQHLIYRRLARAQTMLAMMDISMAEVLDQCGFANHARFSSAFTRQVGMTPSRYRKLMTSGLS